MGLDTVELCIAVEKEFQIEIPNLEAENIQTVGHYYEIIVSKLEDSTISEEDIMRRLKMIIHEMAGVEMSKIKYEASLTNDLVLD